MLNLSKPSTPTELSKKLNIHRSVASRSLIDLEKFSLAQCLNPHSKKQRYYELSKKGIMIRKYIQKL